MLIYIFAEHYPNPYKPQFDTEFAYFLRQGHEIRIFAAGQFMTTVHPRVRQYGLDRRTFLFPTTLKTLPGFAGAILGRLLRSPLRSLRRAAAGWDRGRPVTHNLSRAARILVLPEAPPDLCYVHNLAAARYVDFLGELYPSSRRVLYFHGGEVGGVKRVTGDAQVFRSMDVTFANSGFGSAQVIQRGCPPERVVVVPVGFDLSDYPCEPERPYRVNGVLRLISIGRLSEEKGLILALRALAELVTAGEDQFHYTIVGLGNQEGVLREFVAHHGLDRVVEFAGAQDKAGVVAHLAQSDVLILPSVVTETWAETQAAVVQEAMLMRALVIGTRTGGVPESTAEVLRQFSVEPGEASAIATMIRRIAALPATELARLGDAARAFAAGRFNIDSTGAQLIAHAMRRAPEPTRTRGEHAL